MLKLITDDTGIDNPMLADCARLFRSIIERPEVSEMAIQGPARRREDPTRVFIQKQGHKKWIEEVVTGVCQDDLVDYTQVVANHSNEYYRFLEAPVFYGTLPTAGHRFTVVSGGMVRQEINDTNGFACVIRQGAVTNNVSLDDFKVSGKLGGINAPDFNVKDPQLQKALEVIHQGKAVFFVGTKNSGKTRLLMNVLNLIPERTAIFENQREIISNNHNRVNFYYSRTGEDHRTSLKAITKAIRRMTFDIFAYGETTPEEGPYLRELMGFGTAALLATKHSPDCRSAHRSLFNELRQPGESDASVWDFVQNHVGLYVHLAQAPDGSRGITEIKTPQQIEAEDAARGHVGQIEAAQ